MGILDWLRNRKKKSPPREPREGGLPKEKVTPQDAQPKEETPSQEELKKVGMDESTLVKEAIKRTESVETIPMEEDNVSRPSPVRKIIGIVGKIGVGDHKNWSDRLVDEKLFGSRKDAKAYAAYMRSQGYYAKTVKVQDGYKVYVYNKKGSASIVLSGNWKGLKNLEKLNTKAMKGKTVKGMNLTMGSTSMRQSSLLSFSLNTMDIEAKLGGLNSFDLNFDMGDFNLDFDFGEFGLGGGKSGKNKKK